MKKGTLTHETVNGVAWQSLSIGANLVLRAAILIILTRNLLPEDFGIIAAAMVVISVAKVFSQIGVARVLVQRLTLPDTMIKSAFAISLYSGIAATLLIFFSAPVMAMLFRMDELTPFVRFLSLTLFLNAMALTSESLVQRERRFRAIGLIELGSFVLGFGFVALPLAMADFGAWSLAIAYFIQVIASMVAYWLVRRPAVALWPGEGTRELTVTGLGFMAGQVGNFLARQVDYLVVGRVLGAAPLGYYNRAYQFLMLPAQLFGTAVSKVLFPSIASIQDQPDRVARAFLRASGIVAMLTLPTSGYLIVLAPELILTLLGPEWRGMIVPFQVLVASLLFRTSYKISDTICLAMGSMYQRAWRQWIYAGAVAIGAIAGTQWGLTGVAAGVGLAVVLNFLLMLNLALAVTEVKMSQVLAIHVRQAAIAAGFSAAVWGAATVAREFDFGRAGVLSAGTLAAAAVFAILWFGFRNVFGEEGKWLRALTEVRLEHVRRSKENETA